MARIDYMSHYQYLAIKFSTEETTEMEQWPDTFQSCSQFTGSTL